MSGSEWFDHADKRPACFVFASSGGLFERYKNIAREHELRLYNMWRDFLRRTPSMIWSSPDPSGSTMPMAAHMLRVESMEAYLMYMGMTDLASAWAMARRRPIWRIWAWRTWRLPGRWPDGGLSVGYGHDGPGVCLGDGQTENEGVPSQGGRGDALLRRMTPYLTWPDSRGAYSARWVEV